MKEKTAYALCLIYDETETKFPGQPIESLIDHAAKRACAVLGGQFEPCHVAQALLKRRAEREAFYSGKKL